MKNAIQAVILGFAIAGAHASVSAEHQVGSSAADESTEIDLLDHDPATNRRLEGIAQRARKLFRKSFSACADKTEGRTGAILECTAEEFKYHDDRMNSAYRRIVEQAEPVDGWREMRRQQRRWLAQVTEDCYWDPFTDGQWQLIEAKSCDLNHTAVRAEELERLASSKAK